MAVSFAHYLRRGAALALAGAGLAACVGGAAPRPAEPPAPALHSVAEAERALAQASKARAAAEAQYAASESVCATRFFVNHCLDDAKEKRRTGLAGLRAIEVEAERYKRQASVDERDRALAETNAEALREEQARMAQSAGAAPQPARDEAAAPRASKAPGKRQAEHEEKLRRIAEREQAEAGQRAANVAKFEHKRAAAAERQKKVAAKRAEKAARAAAKAAPAVPAAPSEPAR